MSVWRYKAISAATNAMQSGELSAESAADVRASLRRVGLQVIDLRPVRRLRLPNATVLRPFVERWQRHLRGRRRNARAEFYDGLSTMLDSGLPLAEAVDTLSSVQRGRRSPLRSLANHLRSCAAAIL